MQVFTEPEIRSLIEGAYVLFLLARTDDNMWPLPSTIKEARISIAYAPPGSTERINRLARPVGHTSLTVSRGVIDALLQISKSPGKEVETALFSLNRYRHANGGFGSRGKESSFDGRVPINVSPRHTASAIEILIACGFEDAKCVEESVKWLIATFHDGGWAIDASMSPDFYSTAYVIGALRKIIYISFIRNKYEKTIRSLINSGLDFIVKDFNRGNNRVGDLWKYALIENQHVTDTCDTINKLMPLINEQFISDAQKKFIMNRYFSVVQSKNCDNSYGCGDRRLSSTIWAADMFMRHANIVKEGDLLFKTAIPFIHDCIFDKKQNENLHLLDIAVFVDMISKYYSICLDQLEMSRLYDAISDGSKLQQFSESCPDSVRAVFDHRFHYIMGDDKYGRNILGMISENLERWHQTVPNWVWGIVALGGLLLTAYSLM